MVQSCMAEYLSMQTVIDQDALKQRSHIMENQVSSFKRVDLNHDIPISLSQEVSRNLTNTETPQTQKLAAAD